MNKKCSRCKEEKEADKFYPAKRGPSFLTSYCRPCANIKNSEWARNNPQSQLARTRRWESANKQAREEARAKWRKEFPERHLAKVARDNASSKERGYPLLYRLKKVGATIEQYYDLHNKQDGKCPFCLKQKPLVIDHDHATGRFRGLLCRVCNSVLGLVCDNPDILKRMIEYLKVDQLT